MDKTITDYDSISVNIEKVNRLDNINKILDIDYNYRKYFNDYKLVPLSKSIYKPHYLLFSQNGKYQVEFVYDKEIHSIGSIFISNQNHVDIIQKDDVGFFLEIEYLLLNYIERSDMYRRLYPTFRIRLSNPRRHDFTTRYLQYMKGENLIT